MPKPKLRRLSNAEYELAESRAGTIFLDECPTCGAHPQSINEDAYGFEGTCHGKHKYSCEEQMQLRKHYLVANIGGQYQRLDWDLYDNEPVKKEVAAYLAQWDTAKRQGMGLEFYGKGLGAGKTFAATYVAKELIKRGEKVYFTSFGQMVNLSQRSGSEEFEDYMKSVTVLVLDELVGSVTAAQGSFFASRFEELIRHRTNFNFPTIVTTNLSREEFRNEYPKPYSLLEAKQIQIEVKGDDARLGVRQKINRELMAKGESEPIT